MKASEIIEELERLIESNGDLEVRLNCDHGQELMNSTYIGLSTIEEDAYTPEYGDEGEYDITVIEIQAY